MRDNILCRKTDFWQLHLPCEVLFRRPVSQVSIEINIWAWKYLQYGIIRASANVGFLVTRLQKLQKHFNYGAKFNLSIFFNLVKVKATDSRFDLWDKW